MSLPEFIYVICQAGAEAAARAEILKQPGFKLAFSRRGFLTFKVEPGSLPEKFTLPSTLARSYGWSLGKFTGEDGNEIVAKIAQESKLVEAKQLHVFERENKVPGTQDFEPGTSLLAGEIANLFAENDFVKGRIKPNTLAAADELVFDIAVVEPNEWWFGYHYAINRALRWPGGVPMFPKDGDVVSRAYYKLKEALQWSGIRLQKGETCAEIGSAPGGACQLMLELGQKVIAIDPAEMDEDILANKNLTHLKLRGRDVRKKDLRDVNWLMMDLNLDPSDVLDTAKEIATHESVDLNGVVLTLKLSDWKLVEAIPGFIKRVKGMGFAVVKARQLAMNRQEFCLVAIKNKFMLRAGKKGK